MSIEFKKFDESFLELSWKWLSDPELKFLTASRTLCKEDQIEWYKSLPSRSDYLIWGVSFDFLPVGACGIKNISTTDCEYWGYIGEREYWGRGIGKAMLDFIELEAKQLNIASIWLKVVTKNTRAINLYKKQGYVSKGEVDSMLEMKKNLW